VSERTDQEGIGNQASAPFGPLHAELAEQYGERLWQAMVAVLPQCVELVDKAMCPMDTRKMQDVVAGAAKEVARNSLEAWNAEVQRYVDEELKGKDQ